MSKEKHLPHHSQITGIIWIAAIFALSFVIIFFSSRKEKTVAETDTVSLKNIEKLEKKEDSVYKTRRQSREAYATYSKRTYSSNEKSPKVDSRKQYEVRQDAKSLYGSTPPPTRQPLAVEINSADTTTLQLLHGIGPAFARRIVRYRERLGGFTSTTQLLEVYGFTPQLLDHIAPHLRLDASLLRRLPVNSASLKELIRHPYMEYYLARDIVNLRSHGLRIASPDDLRSLPSATDSTVAKLLPYLDFR